MSEEKMVEKWSVGVAIEEGDDIAVFSDELEEVMYEVSKLDFEKSFIELYPSSKAWENIRVLEWSEFQDIVDGASLFTVERN